MVAGLAVSEELNEKDGDGRKQKYVNVATFVQHKLEHKPNYQDGDVKGPHIEKSLGSVR